MLARNEMLSNITSSSDMIYKSSIDATIGQSCAQNIASYRIVNSNFTVVNSTVPALIPLKAPCCYTVNIKWSYIDNAGGVISVWSIQQWNQVTTGGSLNIGTALTNSSSTYSSASMLTYTKNATKNAVDINIFHGAPLGVIGNEIIEISVFSSSLF
jgi:hypothetical protein